jgi:rRNA maturation protein Nop10
MQSETSCKSESAKDVAKELQMKLYCPLCGQIVAIMNPPPMSGAERARRYRKRKAEKRK